MTAASASHPAKHSKGGCLATGPIRSFILAHVFDILRRRWLGKLSHEKKLNDAGYTLCLASAHYRMEIAAHNFLAMSLACA